VNQFGTALDGFSLVTPQSIADHGSASASPATTHQLEKGEAELALVLMLANQAFSTKASVGQTMADLMHRLYELKNKSAPLVWEHLAAIAQSHPVTEFLLQDPLTRWSFEKPRGYSGDAQLLDFIYEHRAVADRLAEASPLGKEIYDFTRQSASAVAVRERRVILSSLVDRVADERDGAEILAVAAGHLREAELSNALNAGKLKRWIALDQDPLSVGLVQSNFRDTTIEAIDGSVRDILGRRKSLGFFDLVYAAGLYDYLAEDVAVRLTERCLEMLKPGGKFLLANFARHIGVEGYMETFMNWPLLWRNEEEVWSIVRKVRAPVKEAHVTRGENGAVIYAIISV
jgi:SAM-dependent methyltransferase